MHGSCGAGGASHVSPRQLDPGGRGVQVEEDVLGHGPADAASLVRDLDGDVVRALDNVDLNLRHGVRLLVELHGGPHAVLEHLKEHVIEVTGDVDKVNLVRVVAVRQVCTFEVYLGSVHVDLIAEEGSILKCLLGDGGWVTLGVNGASHSVAQVEL